MIRTAVLRAAVLRTAVHRAAVHRAAVLRPAVLRPAVLRPAVLLGAGLIVWSVVAAFWAGLPRQRGLTADPARLLVVGGFLIIAPGLALTTLLAIPDRLLAWVVATGTSLAVLTLTAQAALYLHWWSPVGVVRGIAAGTAVLASAVIVRGRRRVRPPSTATDPTAGGTRP